jgi:hypothetical protein
VSATTGLVLLHTIDKRKIAVASASTGISLGQRSRDAQNPNLYASAATTMNVGSLGDRLVNRAYFKNAETLFYCGIATSNVRNLAASATTRVLILSAGNARQPKVFASATTGLVLGLAGNGNVPRIYLASATTGLVVGNGNVVTNTSKYVSATTRVNLGHIATKLKLGPIYVSATTGLAMKLATKKSMLFAIRVQATTSMDFAFAAANPTTNRARHATATTFMNVGQATATLVGRARLVAATTRMTVGLAVSEVRDVHPTASTAISVGAVSIKNGRDIRVSATTSMAMALVDGSNGFFAKSITPSGLELLVMASASVAGTPADTGLVFLHRADAEVWLPWRRNSLSLPPGGQLPH